MGCDIHLHVEVKVNGKWLHYNQADVDRWYGLFGKMAGVRGTETPIAQPRGLPVDVTAATRQYCYWDGTDGHSISYLSSDEIATLVSWAKSELPEWRSNENFGWLEGGSYEDFRKYPEDFDAEHLEDFRFVFWFDN